MTSKKGKKAADSAMKVFTGKRKRAVARARFEPGSGIVKINHVPLSVLNNGLVRMKLMEPLTLAGDDWKKYDITVNVRGGGIVGQADASRLAIAKGLAEMLGAEARKRFQEYDRYLLIADPRRTEPHKPPRSSQGPRRYKQRSKR